MVMTENRTLSDSVTVRVTDNGTTARSDSETLTVTVNEVNSAPALADLGMRARGVGFLRGVWCVLRVELAEAKRPQPGDRDRRGAAQ